MSASKRAAGTMASKKSKKRAHVRTSSLHLGLPADILIARKRMSDRIRGALDEMEPRRRRASMGEADPLPDDLRLVSDLLSELAFVVEYFDYDVHAPLRASNMAAMAAAIEALTPAHGAAHRWYLSAAERAARAAEETKGRISAR
jgi:hypothetical protein